MTRKQIIIEKLAKLEHDQWIEWAKNISSKENLSSERLARWKKLYVPYEELSEEMKEEDRKWARKVFEIFKEAISINPEDIKKFQ